MISVLLSDVNYLCLLHRMYGNPLNKLKREDVFLFIYVIVKMIPAKLLFCPQLLCVVEGMYSLSSDRCTATTPDVKGTALVKMEDVKYKSQKALKELEKHRQNLFEILKNSNATLIRGRAGIGYMCNYCSAQFPDPADLKIHTLETHDGEYHLGFAQRRGISEYIPKLDITGLRCKLCNKSIDSLESFKKHLIDDHKIHIHTNINNHIIPFKFNGDVLQCCICLALFEKFKILIGHMHSHYSNYVCNICFAGFVNRSALSRHSHNHKTGVFTCKYCEKGFNSLTKKVSHVRNAHTGKFYRCGYCNEVFKDYRLKEVHLTEAHGVPNPTVKCRACDKEFASKKAMKAHINYTHLMEKRRSCDYCDKQFYGSSGLKRHMLKHTGEKKFQCGVCLKSYGRKTTLREHMRIHNNDRRFKCDYCGQAFVQKCSWKAHIRSKHQDLVK
ncbi:zinc finger protein 354B-like [Galleria mellonella]|uniref:Zinc finger protein 354B-like n=1 Tax=Galleria mellonella TaxID=7137 RepID=A0A6J1WGL6_GALME|nr:zinc finger protein 354B-like [Galleria mellonella]